MYVRIMQAGAVQAVAGLRAAFDAFAACDFDSLTRADVLAVLDEYEALSCQLPSPLHRLLAQLQADTTPRELGAKSWNEVLRIRWRLSTAEAGRRLAEAAALGPRRALTGEPLPPVLPVVAAARSAGLINPDHVKVLRDAIGRLPPFVDHTTRQQFEADLVRVAVGVGPKELKDTAELRLFLLDQDGPEPDDTERARKRGLSAGKQGRDAMTALTGNLTPEAAAVWEVLFAKFAAPGMCNPDDDEPCTCGTPTQAQIDNDHRSLAQRQHDALLVVGRIALMTDLGQLNGLPVSVIVRTTLQDLESRAGIGVTGGGTKIPIRDLIRMGAHASHYLAVFDQATGAALNYFRARRVASPAQRIMLIARDGGCTKPGCTVGVYGCQAHHGEADWAAGGHTNVDTLALACGPDNRQVDDDGGYTTTINDHGDVEWHPPPGLDHGQYRINYYHRPELLLTPPAPPDATPGVAYDPEPEAAPNTEPQPASAPAYFSEPAPATAAEWDLEPDPEWTPRWDLAPDPQWEPEPEPEWEFMPDLTQMLNSDGGPDWDPECDPTFDPPTPNIEYLWDTTPFTPEPSDPRLLPPDWIPLDSNPSQPINDHTLEDKAVRGP